MPILNTRSGYSVAVLIAASWIAPWVCAEQDYGPKYLEPTEQVVTPHIDWAKPYDQEPLRVLFITYRTAMREVVELAQRLDMDYEVVAINHPNRLSNPTPEYHIKGDRAEDVKARLAEKLDEDYDLIVLGYVKWDLLPLADRVKILKKVKAGTGLVGRIFPGDTPHLDRALGERLDFEAEEVLSAFPYDSLPAFDDHDSFSSFIDATLDFHRFGDGRIVLFKGFNPPGRQMLTPGPTALGLNMNTLDYDYYLSLAIRAMLYAAQKEPIVSVNGSGLEMSREAMGPVTFALKGKSGRYDTDFVLRSRNNDLAVTETKNIELIDGQDEVQFDLPPVPSGSYFADLWIKREDRIVGFGSISVRVDSDSGIALIALSQDSYGQDESVSCQIQVRNSSPEQSIHVRQYDRVRGLVREVILPVEESSLLLEVPPHQPLSIVQELEVTLLDDNQVLDVTRKKFLINDLYPEIDDFQYYVFEPIYSKSFLNIALGDQFRQMGFDASSYASYYDRKDSHIASMFALANMRTVADIYNYGEPHRVQFSHGGKVVQGEHGPERVRCMTDPQFHADRKALYSAEIKRLAPFSSFEVNLGDETAFLKRVNEGDVCFSSSCLTDFRAFVKQEYDANLESLNEEYGTQFTSWDQVHPAVLEDAKDAPNLLPLWIDHRRHMESVYAGALAETRKIVEEQIPDAMVGYSGSGGSMTSLGAQDHWKIAQGLNLNAPYPNRWFTHFVRDFSEPGSRISFGIIGVYPEIARCGRNPAYMTYWPWFNLYQGGNSLWIWQGSGGRSWAEKAIMAPDFSAYSYFDNCTREVDEIKRGIGTLLLNAERENDGIAVLYSAASNHVGGLTEGLPSLGRTLRAIPGLLEESGFQFSMFSYDQLERGDLNDGQWRLLIMPYTQAVSPEEAEQIKQFVRDGGVVLADLRPAVTNQHGRPYETSPLDEMFGVRQDTLRPIPKTGRVPMIHKKGKLAASTLDASLEVSNGTMLAETDGIPAVIVNEYGKGKAILLNFSLANYGEVEGEWASALLRTFFKNLLATYDIEQAIASDPYHLGMHAYRFTSGDIEYVGLLHDLPAFIYGANLAEIDVDEIPDQTPKPIVFSWADPKHVYESRSGSYLGQAREVSRQIVPGEAQLLALMPYQVDALRLDAPAQVSQGQTLEVPIQVETTNGENPGLHVIRIDLINPSGHTMTGLGVDLKAPQGQCDYVFPVALDQEVGTWQLTVRDVATGIETSTSFEVTPR